MKKLILLLLISVLLINCGSQDNSSTEKKNAAAPAQIYAPVKKTDKQLNLTILLDLSDRIDSVASPAQPHHYQRDTILINHLAGYFVREMISKGGYTAKGKMRVIFHPTPADPNINDAAAKLKIDLSSMKPEQKKSVHDNLGTVVSDNINRIYSTSLSQKEWPGSDIWRFFKNDAKDVAVGKDSSYRNVLVIFTDGYIYHAASKDRSGNRFAYLTPELLDKYKLRATGDIAAKVDKLDFGLITKRSDLQDLEVLVLEVTPSARFQNDEDVIRTVLNKWFTEMKVKRWAVFNSDLPTITIPKVEDFLNN